MVDNNSALRILGIFCYTNGMNTGSGKVYMDREHFMEGLYRCMRSRNLGRLVQEMDGVTYAFYYDKDEQSIENARMPVFPLGKPNFYRDVIFNSFVMVKAGDKIDESLDEADYKRLSMRLRTKAAEAIMFEEQRQKELALNRKREEKAALPCKKILALSTGHKQASIVSSKPTKSTTEPIEQLKPKSVESPVPETDDIVFCAESDDIVY